MKAELIERTDIYNVTHNEKEYTLHVTESNSYCEYQVTDSEGFVMSSEFVDEFMDEFWDAYSEVSTQF
jgi:hypothetical protein